MAMAHDTRERWLDEVMPWPRWLSGEPIPQLPRVATRAEALAAGVGAAAIGYRCRTGAWQRLAPAVYLTASPATAADRMRAALLHGGPRAVVTGAAVLRILGLRSVPEPDSELVLVPSSCASATWGRIRVRRTDRMPQPVIRAGLTLAPAARAVADHVVELRRPDRVQAVVAEVVQRGLCAVNDLAAELESGPRRGSRLFREALEAVGYGAHSVPEARAGRLLRRAGVVGFEQNAELWVAGRRLVADFMWRDLAAILEIDSTEYHLSPIDHERTLFVTSSCKPPAMRSCM